MAGGWGIGISGDKDLERRLRRLERTDARRVVRQGMRKAGRPVLHAARAKIHTKSGATAATIKQRALKRSRVFVGTQIQAGEGAVGHAGVAAHLELGTAHSAAFPFLRPALDENREQVLTILKTEIGRGIEKAAKR